jgi:hypothetical protein
MIDNLAPSSMRIGSVACTKSASNNFPEQKWTKFYPGPAYKLNPSFITVRRWVPGGSRGIV